MTDRTVDVDRERARRLLSDLVSTPSPSGDEGTCAEELVAFFEAQGRESWIDDVGNVRAPADDAVLLTSHIDTVPGEVPVRVEDDVLWGRGSVDAKGPLVALAVAAVRTGVSFAGVVEEEADSRGARHLLATRDPPRAVINGEPSGWDGIALGYRGRLSGTYLATSRSGHTSRPENNAIQDAIEWWTLLEDEFDADRWMPVTERVTPKPIAVDGGLGPDGLSVETTMDVQFRIPIAGTAEAVRERAEAHLSTGTVQWNASIPPVLQDERTIVARAFRAAIRDFDGTPRHLVKTGTSDMNLYAQRWECPMVTYGPGDSELDHTPTERLSLVEFDRSIEVLENVSARLRTSS